MPKLSIITVCLNAEKHIEQTINSVIQQKNVDIEYIVIDGGSTDGTLDIIKRYDSSITRWLSESDSGIADAMNKGIALATGDYLLFLHADDYLIDETVIAKALTRMDTKVDIYAFDVLFKTKCKEIRKQTRPFGLRTYFKTPVMHQGAFCNKALFEKLGGFDRSFKIAMDYDFFYKAKQQGISMEIVHMQLSVMRDTGISSRQDWQSLKQRFMEEKRVHFKNKPSKPMQVLYKVYWALYLPYRRMLFSINASKAT
jgi:glycosyltransferase involved in cell wall biosynthesis